jgi:hypothetical protein
LKGSSDEVSMQYARILRQCNNLFNDFVKEADYLRPEGFLNLRLALNKAAAHNLSELSRPGTFGEGLRCK